MEIKNALERERSVQRSRGPAGAKGTVASHGDATRLAPVELLVDYASCRETRRAWFFRSRDVSLANSEKKRGKRRKSKEPGESGPTRHGGQRKESWER